MYILESVELSIYCSFLIDDNERNKYDQFGSEYVPRKAPPWQASNVWTKDTWDYIR